MTDSDYFITFLYISAALCFFQAASTIGVIPNAIPNGKFSRAELLH
jgi:hypothetical protein